MMNRTLSLPAFTVLALAATLTACGGGGGDNNATATPSPSVQPAPTPAPTQTTSGLSTTILGTTYAPGSAEQTNYDRLNQVRLAGGFGTVAQDQVIDKAATAHAKYAVNYFSNPNNSGTSTLIDPATGWMNAHVEKPTWAGFTGILPKDRVTAAGGNQFGGIGEVIGEGVNCVDDLLNTVFHRSGVLNTTTQFVGIGFESETHLDPMTSSPYTSHTCVINYGYKGAANTVPADWVGIYPGAAQTNVPVGMGPEAPDPDPTIHWSLKGSPASIYFASAIGSVKSFTMTAVGSTVAVPVKLILQKDFPIYLKNSEAHILPTQLLAKGTTYNVAFSGALLSGTQVNKNWSFTTAN